MDTLAGRELALASMGSFTRAIYSKKKNWHMLFITNKASNIKVSVKENEVPTEKNSSRASIFATKESYISN